MKTKSLIIVIIFLFTVKISQSQINMTTNGYVMVGGTATPITPLHVNGDTYIPCGNSYWIGSTNDVGNRLRMHHNSNAAYIDFYPTLHIRIGTGTLSDILFFNNTGLGLFTTSPTAALTIMGRLNVYNSSTNFEVQCGASDPRITTDNNNIVFYKKNASGYVNIECANITATGTGNNMISSSTGTNLISSSISNTIWGPTFINGTTDIQGSMGINTSTPQCDLDVNGILRVMSTYYFSDARLKENIKNIKNPIDSLFLLQGVSYNLKKPVPKKSVSTTLLASVAMDSSKTINNSLKSINNDTLGKSSASRLSDSVLYNHRHMGFIAQDVQKIFPDIVFADKDGVLSIDYIALIPMLVEALKQQNQVITGQTTNILNQQTKITNLEQSLSNLQTSVASCCNLNSKTKDYIESNVENVNSLNTTTQTQAIKLYQNAPNPFKSSTTIKMEIPQTTGNAMVCIYDLNGRQLKCLPVSGRGTTSVEIYGSELTAGLYHYALIVDGSLIDTKTMVLTE
jgi:hypothetical protein